jgi:hypothetical protein
MSRGFAVLVSVLVFLNSGVAALGSATFSA